MSSSNPPSPGQPVVTCCPSGVPVELRALPQFVNWRLAIRKGKPTKIPMQANSRNDAKANDPATWSSYEVVVASWKANDRLAGIGFVFSEDDPYVGIDLDDCVVDGVINPVALSIIESMGTYTEYSPSGTGVKMIGRGKRPPWAKNRSKAITAYKETEVYDSGRFFTLTGQPVEGSPLVINDVQDALLGLCGRLWPDLKPSAALTSALLVTANTTNLLTASMTDDEVLEKMFASKHGDKIRRLWGGDLSPYGNDHSSADQALANYLAYWSNGDTSQIDRLFRKSKLYREKWDREDYRESTIGNAVQSLGQSHKPASVAQTPLMTSASDGPVPLGTRDPESNRLVLSPKKTLPTAIAFENEFFSHPDGRSAHHYADAVMVWNQGRYVEVEDAEIRNQLQPWLHNALRYIADKKSGELKLVDFESNPGTVRSAFDTLCNHLYLKAKTPSPAWLVDDPSLPPPGELIPCRNILLHLPTNRRIPSTPKLFNVNALDFDPDPDAPVPEQWLAFINDLFEDDVQSIQLLQEWFGYSLTGDTSQQKMLLMVGPKRSGKGTTGRILARLAGEDNVCGPTTGSLAGTFGLQSLIGKSLAVVSDARFSGDSIKTVIERLLCISGEDALTIDRKHKTSVTMKLPTRFVFMTNELPRFNDASGALAGRFMILRMTKSFYGKEDRGLTDRLIGELPGILNWAIEGWKRLHERGHFVQPESVQDSIQELEDLSSPVGAFVRERCVVGSGFRIEIDHLYLAYRQWCEAEGRQGVATKSVFSRDLLAAVAGIRSRRNQVTGRFFDGICLSGGPA